MPNGQEEEPAALEVPGVSHKRKVADISKQIIDRALALGESVTQKAVPEPLAGRKSEFLRALRQNVLLKPENAVTYVEELARQSVGKRFLRGDVEFQKLADLTRQYRDLLRTPAEAERQEELATPLRETAERRLTGLKELQQRELLREPLTTEEKQKQAAVEGGIAQDIKNLRATVEKMAPKGGAPPKQPLPGQKDLADEIKDRASRAPTGKSQADIILEMSGELGIPEDSMRKELLARLKMNDEAARRFREAPQPGKGDELARFLLYALAFGPREAFRLYSSEKSLARRERLAEEERLGRERFETLRELRQVGREEAQLVAQEDRNRRLMMLDERKREDAQLARIDRQHNQLVRQAHEADLASKERLDLLAKANNLSREYAQRAAELEAARRAGAK